jgi:hypothetical protein
MAAPSLAPLVLVHGIVFTVWIVTQTTLVARKRVDARMGLGTWPSRW